MSVGPTSSLAPDSMCLSNMPLTLLGLRRSPVAFLVAVVDVAPIIVPRGGVEPAHVQVAAVSATANPL